LKTLRRRFPGARQLVYERRQSLPIDDPYICGLMAQAVKIARADLTVGAGQVILQSKRRRSWE
jgi:hypothetical protein